MTERRLMEIVAELCTAAEDLCPTMPVFEDARIEWVEVQIDRDALERFNRAVEAYREALK